MFQLIPGANMRMQSQSLEMEGLDLKLFQKASGLFNSLRLRADLKHFVNRLLQRKTALLDLSSIYEACRVAAQYELGSQSIPLDKIVGSASRSQDYDSNFRPLRNHLSRRWIKIAALRMMNVDLPAIELIQIGDIYFVIDGHHRVSVARALGQTFIDAKVIVWHLELKPRPEMVAAGAASPQFCPSGLNLAKAVLSEIG